MIEERRGVVIDHPDDSAIHPWAGDSGVPKSQKSAAFDDRCALAPASGEPATGTRDAEVSDGPGCQSQLPELRVRPNSGLVAGKLDEKGREPH
jgi:hypothetical protein